MVQKCRADIRCKLDAAVHTITRLCVRFNLLEVSNQHNKREWMHHNIQFSACCANGFLRVFFYSAWEAGKGGEEASKMKPRYNRSSTVSDPTSTKKLAKAATVA